MARERREEQLSLFPLGGGAAVARAPAAAVGPAAVSDDVRALGRRLPPAVRLGTSSWAFPGWSGLVYDRELAVARLARDGLAAYARHPLLRTVGVDRTYYAPIAAADFAAYAAAVPDDFRFLVKAPELCTLARFPHHERYGAQRGERNARWLDPGFATEMLCGPLREGLGDKAGVIVFQFPPQRVVELGGAEPFAERLYAFLAELPRELVYAVELRNAELLTATYGEALAAARACHCVNVHPHMPPPDAQADRFDGAAAPALVVRWMLGHGFAYEQARQRYAPFDRLVDEDPTSRRQIAELCRRSAARGRPAFVIINNKAEGSAPCSVCALAAEIAAH